MKQAKRKLDRDYNREPLRAVRVPGDAWAKWRAHAAAERMSVSELIRSAVDREIKLAGRRKRH